MARVTGSTNTEEVSCILWLVTSLEPEIQKEMQVINFYTLFIVFIGQTGSMCSPVVSVLILACTCNYIYLFIVFFKCRFLSMCL